MKKKINKQVTLGYDAGGKRIRRWIHADTQADFNRQLFEMKKEFEMIRNPSDIAFADYAEKWLETYKGNKAFNTRSVYVNALSKCESIDHKRVRDITKTDLQQIINNNIEHPATCHRIKETFNQIFDCALDDGIIAVHPGAKLELPKYAPKEKRSFTEKEREIIKTVKLTDRQRAFLDLLYYFGLRRGEALAVTRSDFDFKRLLLRVNKSVAFDGNAPVTGDTKTHTVRYVPIPHQIAPRLQKYCDSCGLLLFTDKYGKQIRRSAYNSMWKNIRDRINEAAGGDKNFHVFRVMPHMIRHDYATRLYYVPGISTKKKAEILGHSEKLFLELYSHLDNEKEDLETFQKLMNF